MTRSPLGREIFRTYDEYGPVQVFDDGHCRYLSFGEGEEQSCVAMHAPHVLQHDYTRAMLLPLLFVQPRQALLLGLGGGALVHALLQALPELELTAVELRRAVIGVARRYFGLPRPGSETSRLRVINDDAGEFLEAAATSSCDLLCSDLYGGEGLALQFFQPWFIEECARVLRPDGWLVLNCWHEHRAATDTLETLEALFQEVRSCATPGGNWVIIASRQRITANSRALQAAAKGWSRQLGFSLGQPLRDLRQHQQSDRRPDRREAACTSN